MVRSQHKTKQQDRTGQGLIDYVEREKRHLYKLEESFITITYNINSLTTSKAFIAKRNASRAVPFNCDAIKVVLEIFVIGLKAK
jgi:hypothetical protein